MIEEILGHLKYLGSTEQFDKQSALAFELFNCFIIRADLRKPSLANMAVNLWNLSQRHGLVDSKMTVNVYFQYLEHSDILFCFTVLLLFPESYVDEDKGLHAAEKSPSRVWIFRWYTQEDVKMNDIRHCDYKSTAETL